MQEKWTCKNSNATSKLKINATNINILKNVTRYTTFNTNEWVIKFNVGICVWKNFYTIFWDKYLYYIVCTKQFTVLEKFKYFTWYLWRRRRYLVKHEMNLIFGIKRIVT